MLGISKELLVAFYHARVTGQGPVRLTKENGMAFSDQTRPTEKNGRYDRLKWITSRGGPECSSWTEPKWTFPFNFRPEFVA